MQTEHSFDDIPNWRSPQMIALWSKFSLEQRAEKLDQAIHAGRELMMAGIILREPSITDSEAQQRLKQLLYRSYNKV